MAVWGRALKNPAGGGAAASGGTGAASTGRPPSSLHRRCVAPTRASSRPAAIPGLPRAHAQASPHSPQRLPPSPAPPPTAHGPPVIAQLAADRLAAPESLAALLVAARRSLAARNHGGRPGARAGPPHPVAQRGAVRGHGAGAPEAGAGFMHCASSAAASDALAPPASLAPPAIAAVLHPGSPAGHAPSRVPGRAVCVAPAHAVGRLPGLHDRGGCWGRGRAPRCCTQRSGRLGGGWRRLPVRGSWRSGLPAPPAVLPDPRRQGIMAAVRFRPNEGTTRVAAITNHALIQGAASACVALGFYAIYRNKARWGRLLQCGALWVLLGTPHRRQRCGSR